MKNLIVILIIAVAAWFIIKQAVPKGKPDDAITKYGNSLKHDEDMAKDSAMTANTAVLQGAVNSFRASNGKFPDNLQELVDKGFMQSVPAGDYTYDAQTGVVGAR
jgi:ABC-type microcin C transport system permease subunit YejB